MLTLILVENYTSVSAVRTCSPLTEHCYEMLNIDTVIRNLINVRTDYAAVELQGLKRHMKIHSGE